MTTPSETEVFRDEAEEYNEPAKVPTMPTGRDPKADAAEEADEKEREAAFDAQPEWNGELLQGFSLERERLFMSHRCAVGAPRLSRAVDDWEAFLADAIRILYFCSHLPAEFMGMARDPGRLEAAIVEWGTECVPREKEDEARVLGMQILADAKRNQHDTAPTGIRRKADTEGN